MRSAGTPCGHQVSLLEDAVNGGERGLKQALIPRRHRQDAMRQIGMLLTLGQRHNRVDLLGQNPMPRVLGAGEEIGQRLALPGLLLPANDAPVFDRQERTGPTRRNALLLGGRHHREDFQFGLRFDPQAAYRSHEPPFVFFRRIASSTDWSASARSLSWSSRLSASWTSVLT